MMFDAGDTLGANFCAAPVAIKIIKQRQVKRIRGGEANVHREIQIMSQLHHPNVLQLMEVLDFPDKGKQYLVLEHVDGGTVEQLRDRTESGRLSEHVARRYYMHENDKLFMYAVCLGS